MLVHILWLPKKGVVDLCCNAYAKNFSLSKMSANTTKENKKCFTLSQLDQLSDTVHNFSRELFNANRAYKHNLINNYVSSRDSGIYQYIYI